MPSIALKLPSPWLLSLSLLLLTLSLDAAAQSAAPVNATTAATAATPTAQPGSAPSAVSGKQLADRLASGGLIIYFRHTRTHRDQLAHESRMRSAGELKIEDCATQRNLNEQGLQDAKLQQQALTALKVAPGETLVSAYCRTRQHADKIVDGYTLSDVLTPPRNKEKVSALRGLLSKAPSPGTNRWIFAHGGVLWGATDYDSVESETFIFEPVAAGERPRLIASIRIDDWAALVAGKPCCTPRSYWKGDGTPPE